MDDEETGGPFTVHWLNNKELHFTLAMEVFLQQLRGSLEQQSECSQEGTEKYSEQAVTLPLKAFFCMLLCTRLSLFKPKVGLLCIVLCFIVYTDFQN